ncbi:hypothetical protein ACMG4P_05070 [Pseudovibrio denitrificans]|uniref:hypothetical protein n=1 Tax=Pseudovibrio denitrificans TaxID=258256 RepID=UPI0039BF8235
MAEFWGTITGMSLWSWVAITVGCLAVFGSIISAEHSSQDAKKDTKETHAKLAATLQELDTAQKQISDLSDTVEVLSDKNAQLVATKTEELKGLAENTQGQTENLTRVTDRLEKLIHQVNSPKIEFNSWSLNLEGNELVLDLSAVNTGKMPIQYLHIQWTNSIQYKANGAVIKETEIKRHGHLHLFVDRPFAPGQQHIFRTGVPEALETNIQFDEIVISWNSYMMGTRTHRSTPISIEGVAKFSGKDIKLESPQIKGRPVFKLTP